MRITISTTKIRNLIADSQREKQNYKKEKKNETLTLQPGWWLQMDWVQHACKQGKGLDWSEHQNLLQNQSHTTKNKSFRFFRTRFLFFFCSFPNPINSIYLIYLLQPDCVRINDSSTPHFSDVISPSLLAGGMGLINGKTWPYIMEWKPLKEGAYSLTPDRHFVLWP